MKTSQEIVNEIEKLEFNLEHAGRIESAYSIDEISKQLRPLLAQKSERLECYKKVRENTKVMTPFDFIKWIEQEIKILEGGK